MPVSETEYELEERIGKLFFRIEGHHCVTTTDSDMGEWSASCADAVTAVYGVSGLNSRREALYALSWMLEGLTHVRKRARVSAGGEHG